MLFLLVLALFLLRFPLGKLPLSFLTLEKCLYLRDQDTGQGFHFVVGNPGAVGVGILFCGMESTVKAVSRRTDDPGKQDRSLPAVRVTAPTEIASWIVSVGVGIAETNDIHLMCPLL